MKSIYSTIDPVQLFPRRIALADKPATAKLTLGEARPFPVDKVFAIACSQCGHHLCSCPSPSPKLSFGRDVPEHIQQNVQLKAVVRAVPATSGTVRCGCGATDWLPLEGIEFGFKCAQCARFIVQSPTVTCGPSHGPVAYQPGLGHVLPDTESADAQRQAMFEAYSDERGQVREGVWTPKGSGIAENVPPAERWRGSVLGLGSYDLEPRSYGQLYFKPHFTFVPKRFRITANGLGVRVQVQIQNRAQYRVADHHYIPYLSVNGADGGGLPAEAFVEDGVNDKLDPIQCQACVYVRLVNTSHERRSGEAWFEGEKFEENY